MKKLIYVLAVFLLSVAMLVSCGSSGDSTSLGDDDDDDNDVDLEGWDLVADYDWFIGKPSPYDISTPQELAGLALLVNQGGYSFKDQTINQTANLDLGGRLWIPIGVDGSDFKGTYDGKGKTISGLTINNPDPLSIDQGLFGVIGKAGDVANATILVKDVILLNVSITGNTEVGAVAGLSYGTVEECSVTGSVNGFSIVGGVVGYNFGTVKECSATAGSVTCTSGIIGGIVGQNGPSSVVDQCTFSGTVSGEIADKVGGIVGENGGTVSVSKFTSGTVNGSKRVGGIVGYSFGTGATVSGCSFSGANVTGSGDFVGGIAGSNYAKVEDCSAASGIVKGASYVGGVVGYSFGPNAAMSGCSFSGASVTGTTGVGGIVGWNEGATAKVESCSATGDSVTGSEYVGGIAGVGSSGSSIENCYATSAVKATTGSAGGIVGAQINSSSSVQYCYATGSVEGSSASGIAGGTVGNVTNSVALNASVTGTSAVRISGSSGSLNTNYGKRNMPSGLWSDSGFGVDGADVNEGEGSGQYNNLLFWNGAVGFAFTKWEWAGAGPGTIPGTNALPVLKWEVE